MVLFPTPAVPVITTLEFVLSPPLFQRSNTIAPPLKTIIAKEKESVL